MPPDIFFQFFYRFFRIFSNWPDPVDLMGLFGRIHEHLFSAPKSHFKSFLFSFHSLPFIFRPPLSYSLYLQLLNTSLTHLLSFFTSFTSHSLKNPPQSKSPKLLSQTLTVCTLIWSPTSFFNGT